MEESLGIVERVVRAGCAKGCSWYVVGSVYVRPDRVFSRLVKALEDEGALLHYVDEVERRIVFKIGFRGLAKLAGLIALSSRAVSLELKASCRIASWAEALECIMDKYRVFKRDRESGTVVAYGVVGGRIVEAEVKGSRLHLKIGRRFGGSLRSAPPQGLFRLSLEEVLELMGHGGG
ncbi:hypothetical protein apy_07430 [Aeropyrum pernix]|uniref:Uncharacterized protein n=1 Tax=Aeropyrum pernix TaxID=56636 RepID=A0A401H9H4_AERPX|nr:hypothetical protein [Aeropyrum pernix]GBF09018.1 hypothetical protein apy_07430 [Aeropyrum pernix]